MVFMATSNNISIISWWSVVLVEEPEVPVENHHIARNDGDSMYHFQRSENDTHAIMNDIVYIDHMKITDVPASPS
jgi:hypothetical protein